MLELIYKMQPLDYVYLLVGITLNLLLNSKKAKQFVLVMLFSYRLYLLVSSHLSLASLLN